MARMARVEVFSPDDATVVHVMNCGSFQFSVFIRQG